MDNIEIAPQKAIIDGVDPTLRAHIYGLVSALGGLSPDDPDLYVLGDDVIGCLRDIKRWLRGYDDKLDRLDVARCLSEANLVVDLMGILSHLFSKGIPGSAHPNKIGLACVELLVPLTWPLNKTEISMTVNHHRHLAVLRRSQAYYKKYILTHRSECILKACCVNALPSMAIPPRERTPRDDGIIRLVLYLIRNLLRIEEPESDNGSGWEDISKSSTIEILDRQGVLNLLLSIISGVPELFEQQDVIIIEVIFYLILGINMKQLGHSMLGPTDPPDPLAQLLRNDDAPVASKTQSRHTRFGTTIEFKKDDGRKKVMIGPGALLDEITGLQRSDAAKKWRKPVQNGHKKRTLFDGREQLSPFARSKLCDFLRQMLVSGFDCLFQSVRKAVERDSERVLSSTHILQLFFVGGALIEFGRTVKRGGVILINSKALQFRDFSGLLQPETFIVLFRHIREGLESKSWDYVQSGSRYFTQALLLVSDMIQSSDGEERSVAENIFNRLFYEETLQDLMITVLRSGRKQTLEYLDSSTEMIHVYLRCLEKYSKGNVSMVVRSKRLPKSRSNNYKTNSGSDSDTDLNARSQAAEKTFQFQQLETKFLSQPSVEPFLDFLSRYKELNLSQIKRCIGFLHRVFVKRGVTVGLFHIKTIRLLQLLARDTKGSPGYLEIAGFVQYFSRHLIRKLGEYPVLFVEILFQKSSKIGYFIQHGEDKGRRAGEQRLPPDIEMEKGLNKERQIAIAVSLVAQDDACKGQLGWVESVLHRSCDEREKGEKKVSYVSLDERSPAIVIKFPDSSHSQKHFSSNKLQLLLRVLGFEPEGSRFDEFCYVLPSTVSSLILRENTNEFLKFKASPISKFEDGKELKAYYKLKQTKRVIDHGVSAGEYNTDSASDGIEFPDNIKGAKSSGAKRLSRSSGRKRTIDEEEARRRRQERKLKENERRQGIKSGLYIGSSDDDSDVERDRVFFEKERILREAMSKATINAEGNIPRNISAAYKKRSILDETTREPKRLRTADSNSGPDSTISDNESVSTGILSSDE